MASLWLLWEARDSLYQIGQLAGRQHAALLAVCERGD